MIIIRNLINKAIRMNKFTKGILLLKLDLLLFN